MANNPSDPESASMEVSETKLVNFAEKTKFDISKVIKAPPLPGIPGLLSLELRKNNLELLSPDLSLLVGSDGTWNGNAPSFRFKNTVTGTEYSHLSEVPGLKESTIRDLSFKMETAFIPNFVSFLKTLNLQNIEVQNIFELDPNQLLTVSEGYKVLLRRPLDG